MKFTKVERIKPVGSGRAINVSQEVYNAICDIADATGRTKGYIATMLLEEALKGVEVEE